MRTSLPRERTNLFVMALSEDKYDLLVRRGYGFAYNRAIADVGRASWHRGTNKRRDLSLVLS